ncbi:MULTISPECIES: ABC transporter permease [Micromonospora]|uniref:Transport permease protein n=1 Tax=Micromonospora yangpuensis TaxID=683228 RepID=A0A1C6UNA3_9ACTN|nr:ABC transporter permease [Micromonospora yangpuensis]GGM09716.1 transport permease protein [Micromonospora yangpuensis]SCL55403.1 ABC-2 type transport system permease protein [Micromonospora yangpuensis]
MTAVDTPTPLRTAWQPRPRPHPARVLAALLRRDLMITGRELWVILLQVGLTPLFMLFVFDTILGAQGIVGPGFADLFLPGIIALAALTTALQSVALPLVKEFGFTMEIEDRLMAPLPTGLVAIGKLVIATIRGLLAAVLVYPLGALVVGSAPWRPAGLPTALLTALLGAWIGAAIGMSLATTLPVQRINVTFSVILTPIIWTGCIHYPWPRLSSVPWYQTLTALNPMTYVSEGVRGALLPDVPHLPGWLCLTVLTGTAVALTWVSVRCFIRRAVQ